MDIHLFNEIKRNIAFALKEDQVKQDLTSKSCFSELMQASGKLILKERAVLAGLIFLPLICEAVDPEIELNILKEEGERAESDDLLATMRGSIDSLMALERVALNFLQHATGIATTVASYVFAVQGKCDILDTRKTMPGHRLLQKYAVRIGGGKNHRLHLSDQILIKDNHLQHLKKTCENPIQESIERAKAIYPKKQIQIEVGDLKEFRQALKVAPDKILLDNMRILDVKKAVDLGAKKVYLEASGGIDLTNVRSYADTGVDAISIGKLTHSVTSVDMSLEI